MNQKSLTMARPKKINNTKELICLNCNGVFIIPKYKNRTYCSQKCAQTYTKSINKNWLKIRDTTNMERYGVKSPFESEQVKNKYKDNLMVKYGVDNPFLVKEFRDKADQTILDRYGVKVATQNKIISDKISQSLKGKTPDTTTKIKIRWQKIQNYCKEQNLTPLFNEETLSNGFIKDLDRLGFKCNKCEVVNEVSIINGYLPTCNKCSKYKGYSIIEEEITNFIQTHYKGTIQLKNRSLLFPYEIDIYLPELNLAIEVNGIYWHSEIWGKYKNYHLNKTEGCLKQDIHLIHIFDHEWITKQNIIKSIILNKLKLTPNKIHARKCEIREINTDSKNLFLHENHIQGKCISKTNIGLYYNNELVSIMTFGKNRFKKDNSVEMIRFCNKINTNVVGGASKLFQYYINNYNPQTITTFADRRFSLGNLYNTLGFNFNSFSHPSYFYWKNMKIYNRINFQKHKLPKLLNIFDINLSEYENMLKNGYNRVWDCGNYKFTWQNKSIQ